MRLNTSSPVNRKATRTLRIWVLFISGYSSESAVMISPTVAPSSSSSELPFVNSRSVVGINTLTAMSPFASFDRFF